MKIVHVNVYSEHEAVLSWPNLYPNDLSLDILMDNTMWIFSVPFCLQKSISRSEIHGSRQKENIMMENQSHLHVNYSARLASQFFWEVRGFLPRRNNKLSHLTLMFR